MPIRVVVQRGPKAKKSVAFAVDWPGWSRGDKTADGALETLEAYRERYRPIAVLAGLQQEFDDAGKLDIVEDHVGTGSTDGVGTVQVSVDKADAHIERAEGQRDVDRGRRLADTTLATGHGDDRDLICTRGHGDSS
jgi:hypothetical protein